TRREGHSGIDLEVGFDPVPRREANGLHPADPDAAKHDRIPDAEAAHGAEAGGVHRLGFAEVRARQPERPTHHEGEGGNDRQADRELVFALHEGIPSMNCRTSGSWVVWISATDPTCRIFPSYNIAIRSPTV